MGRLLGGRRAHAALAAALLLTAATTGSSAAHAAITDAEYVPVKPARVLDTRSGVGAPAAPVAAEGMIELTVTGGVAGVPDDAAAVVLNVTVTQSAAAGYITAYPCGETRPTASNVNLTGPGQTVANLVVAKVGDDGQVCLYSKAGAHVIADLNGWFPAGAAYAPIAPHRVLDTRSGVGAPAGALGDGDTLELTVVGGAAQVPADASAVALNVTVTQSAAAGYATVFPCGGGRPTASNVNVTGAGQTVANLVVVKVGDGGTVCLFSKGGAHLIADVNGWFPTGAEYTSIAPVRVLDTRSAVGAPSGPVAAGGVVQLAVTGGAAAVPTSAMAVVLNVTAAESAAAGYVTVFPCSEGRPTASNVNVTGPGQTVANLVVAKVGDDGTVCLYTKAGVELVADLNGWFPAPGDPPDDAPDPTVGEPLESGGAELIGEVEADGFPADLGEFDPGPAMAAVGDGGGLPQLTADIAADAPAAPEAEASMSTMAALPPGGPFDQMLANEPTYSFSGGFATDVNRAVGRVVMWRYLNGQWQRVSSCSGTSVGNNMVLTAAHCLRDQNKAGYEYFSFIPGLYGSTMPNGEWFAPQSRAYAHQTYFDLANVNNSAAVLLDYALIKFDPYYNNGYGLTASVSSFGILMDQNPVGRSVYNVGYPVEGYYSSANNGWCDLASAWCYPYACQSTIQGTAQVDTGWWMIGFGCDGNGGISGSGVFTELNGSWYVLTVNDYGGDNRDRNGQECPATQRHVCSWYMRNSWGPRFVSGWIDALYNEVAAL